MQVIPCAVLALLINPSTSHHLLNRIFWPFRVYLEAVSVLPQLRVMQNTKIVEPLTTHWVLQDSLVVLIGFFRYDMFLKITSYIGQEFDSFTNLVMACLLAYQSDTYRCDDYKSKWFDIY
nr:ER lumen protein-retaining receptor-like [Arachis hypogaea]